LERFTRPFSGVIGPPAIFLDFPDAASGVPAGAAIAATRAQLHGRHDVAAIIIEPIQGRGGCIIPPHGYLRALRELCDECGMLMIVDEIYTGFGRTGTWFAIESDGVVPDILCIGKAMGGGFPISAAVARSCVMDAWPVSSGEALHTSTYLGNPMGCAAALATIGELQRLRLPERAAELGKWVAARLESFRAHRVVAAVRGRGAFWGIEFTDPQTAERTVKDALRRGVIALQSGPTGSVVSVIPPLTISEAQLSRALDLLEAAVVAAE
jgi:4-aminobutyrate aminotransferase-like enzyme